MHCRFSGRDSLGAGRTGTGARTGGGAMGVPERASWAGEGRGGPAESRGGESEREWGGGVLGRRSGAGAGTGAHISMAADMLRFFGLTNAK